MNKVNWVDGRYTTPADFNAMQSAPESHLRSQAKIALAGHIDGLTPTGTADGVQVAPGVTWDDQGRRIMVPAATPVDVSAILRPASGHYRWVGISIAYRQVERSTVRDSGGVDQPAYLDDGFTLTATSGPEFAADSLTDARWTETGKPAVPNGSVGLGNFVVDHDSGWGDLVHVIHRHAYISSHAVFISSTDRGEISRLVSAIAPAAGSVGVDRGRVYGWGLLNFTTTDGSALPAAGGQVLYATNRSGTPEIAVAVATAGRNVLPGLLHYSVGWSVRNVRLHAVFMP